MKAGCISGIILAAGASRRFGEPKQLLPIGGQAMLRGVVAAALESSLSEVVLVLGCRSDEIIGALQLPELLERAGDCSRGFKLVVCEDWEQGASASLKTGLVAAAEDADAAAILLGDQPGVGAELIDHVMEAAAMSKQPLARPVFAARDSAATGCRPVPGHPVVIARSLWPEMAKLNGDEGARGLIARRPEALLEIHMPGEPPADVDTRDDYLRLLRSLNCE